MEDVDYLPEYEKWLDDKQLTEEQIDNQFKEIFGNDKGH